MNLANLVYEDNEPYVLPSIMARCKDAFWSFLGFFAGIVGLSFVGFSEWYATEVFQKIQEPAASTSDWVTFFVSLVVVVVILFITTLLLLTSVVLSFNRKALETQWRLERKIEFYRNAEETLREEHTLKSMD